MISHLVVFVVVVMGMLHWIFLSSFTVVDGQHVPHVPRGGDGGLHDLDLDDDP